MRYLQILGRKIIRYRLRLTVIVLAAALLSAILYYIFRPRPAVEELPTVMTEAIATDHVDIYGEYVGRIRAQQFVEVHARVEGYLEKMVFKEGAYITKGQTLFVIDPRLYKAHVEKAKAQLNKDRKSVV